MDSGAATLLETKIEQAKAEQAPNWPDDNYFELFCAQNIIAKEAINSNDIEDGRLGDGRDGGIDAFYVFVNGRLLQEGTDPKDFQRQPHFDVYLIQAKREASFKESAADKFVSSASNLFDISKDLEAAKYKKLYHEPLREKVSKFRDTYLQLAGRNPTIHFRYFYATKGDKEDINEAVEIRVDEIEETIKSLFPDAEFSFDFIGARELVDLTRLRPSEEYDLEITEHLTAAPKGVIALVTLSSYNSFMRDEQNTVITHIFDDNVRDYQNSVEVNKGIAQSLRNPGEVDFWYLNNGITILSETAVVTGKTIRIVDPQIINGLQTSFEILAYFDERVSAVPKEPDTARLNDNRLLLVKILPAASSSAKDSVIKATNSQTGVSAASLQASDTIQRDIEEILLSNGYYYDRRKNFYKNEGIKRDQIIGILQLAQAVMSILLQRPNDARARPGNLIKNEVDYKQIFNKTYDPQMYVVVTAVRKRVEDRLRERKIDRGDRNNLLFYVMMRVASKLTKRVKPNSKHLAKLEASIITDKIIDNAYKEIEPIYKKLGGDATVAKGRELVKATFGLATRKKARKKSGK